MPVALSFQTQASSKYHVFLCNKSTLTSFNIEIQEYLANKEESIATFSSPTEKSIYIKLEDEPSSVSFEKARKLGFECFQLIKSKTAITLSIHLFESPLMEQAFLEGLLLSSYAFEKYKTKKSPSLKVELVGKVAPPFIDEIQNLINAVFTTRDLVNEPQSTLNSTAYKTAIEQIFHDQQEVTVTILEKKQLEALQMNALLAVNAASNHPPYFAVCEYKPKKANNTKPIILVGKGVVYDTGGLSIKPTQNSMDIMKCDMAGSAAVIGGLLAATSNKLPLHIIALVPITDNWIGPKSFAPGDVLMMANGKSVEVMDTDAEGRLILADALLHAQKFNPELVIDLATLTGSAVRAIGKEGIVYMGNAQPNTKQLLEKSGAATYERLVEFPLWDEYGEQLKSSIADIKNLGGDTAGAITAGKFLEHFIDYDWLHLDIAGPAYIAATDSYRGKEATGVGVRLLYHFLKTYNS